ncbi:MAG: aspartate carbamoyltransferase catalytic subunit [Dehalococcoidia bacterium]|nr:aspartate carbamoyltransferase catalytic subunit [Dehalococcoidia bacterium]
MTNINLHSRSLVTIDDLSNGEIEALFSLTDEMSESLNEQSEVCRGKIMASLFFEPSTRTRLSFETAMLRLGGHVISAIDIGSSSLSKGESIADMARVAGSYADIIVIRHPWEGAARVVADYAGIPVINAGDGSHAHPTQTLCDLYTLKKEKQTLKGLKIAFWGDLKHGRTTHSLSYALARFGATILFHPSPGLEMPEHVLRKLTAECGGKLERDTAALGYASGEKFFPVEAAYITPNHPHQLAMMPDICMQVEFKTGVDALYVTRLQKERFVASPTKEGELQNAYPVVDKKLLERKEFKKTLVMHPLPRVDELAYEIDADPRSMYFKQAARGVPVRMALISLMLGDRNITVPEEIKPFGPKTYHPTYKHGTEIRCPNPICISNQETEIKYIRPEFRIVNLEPPILECTYCEHELRPKFIASSDWHEGTLEYKNYHKADSHWIRKIKPDNLIVFTTEEEALAQGFKPDKHIAQNDENSE